MTLSRQNQKISHYWMFLLYLIFFSSIIFSMRALSSISIAALLLSSLILNKLKTGGFFNKTIINLFAISCLVFYLLQFAGLLYTHNTDHQWHAIRLKSSLFFIPLAVSCYDFLDQKIRSDLLIGYCLLLFAAALYCLTAALVHYTSHQNDEVFFYHGLVKPLQQHAIQFSILVFIALLFLFENLRKDRVVLSKYLHILLLIFFTGFLILLSSKLIIALYFVYLLYFLFSLFRRKTNNLWIGIISTSAILSITAVVFITKNPISQRFNEVIKGDINFTRQKKFTPGDYFTGLQFRLLQWRFVSEILTEENAWVYGVTTADAQQKLDEKYISENMYIGELYRNDRGFLGYNTHNQLLGSLLQSGIIGGIVFLVICFSMIKMAWVKKNRLLSLVVIVLLLYSFSESVFESQYSLLIFIFFPLFLYSKEAQTNEKHS